jgi:serine/threonine-protein kinase
MLIEPRAEEIFFAAIAHDEAKRAAFVIEECRGDAALEREVRALLDAHDEAGGYFEWLSGQIDALLDEGEPMPNEPFGPYRAVRLLGRGGMGSVYLAERIDEQFEKKVALKVLPIGLVEPVSRARFLLERQILARLVHPNIARLLDGGVTDDGTPYFVMDYVDGVPIDVHCDEHRLSLEARLALFCEVCIAVQYAHANLVVHRDLKPANILVDDSGAVRLVDFGIAKVLDSSTEEAALTQVVGRPLTPLYASPEMLRGEPVTTAADVYALGVLLYTLLCGRPPFRIEGLTSTAAARLLCEQEPLRPSEAVAQTTDPSEGHSGADAIATRRGVRADRLSARLRGDLDTIVAKALAKEPRRRYQSVEQFEEDIRRHLQGLPVHARPPTRAYRFWKFLRRHPTGVASGVTAALLLALVGILTTNFAITTARQAVAIAAERDRVEQTQQFLLDIFAHADPNQTKGADVTAREILDRAAQRIRTELAAQERIRADLSEAIAGIYQSLSEHEPARALFEEARGLRARIDGTDSAEYAATVEALAQLYEIQGDYASAEGLADEALRVRRALAGPEGIVGAALRLATIQHRRDKLDEAEALYREALALARSSLGEHVLVPNALHALGSLLERRGNLEEAEALHREGLAMRQRLVGNEHLDLIESYYNLGSILQTKGALEEALRNYEQALAIGRKLTPGGNADEPYMLNAMALLHEDLGDPRAAEARYGEALAILRRYFDESHPNVGIISANLAMLLYRNDDFEAAEPLLRTSLATISNSIPDHPKRALVALALGDLYVRTERLEEAERVLAAEHETRPSADTAAALAKLREARSASDAAQDRKRLVQP